MHEQGGHLRPSTNPCCATSCPTGSLSWSVLQATQAVLHPQRPPCGSGELAPAQGLGRQRQGRQQVQARAGWAVGHLGCGQGQALLLGGCRHGAEAETASFWCTSLRCFAERTPRVCREKMYPRNVEASSLNREPGISLDYTGSRAMPAAATHRAHTSVRIKK